MTIEPISPQSPSPGAVVRHAISDDDLTACFPVIAELRPRLENAGAWRARASAMAGDGYRVLAVWNGERALAVAGYRVMENLIHGRFLYVDDLVTAADQRGNGFGAALLRELSIIGARQACVHLALDTATDNVAAQRFYRREGLADRAIRFVKLLEAAP
ncbi:GNAT family N-acetyltransferase [Chelatococcus reniformis]|uniref:N-acetyltransferase GCN5 n=1 Tax=Chelatococcus reniformis TaxID=1494448 RepID=A0A916X7J0_9HYPH|nr:GNAT family N-acetyltransferase [Chelatococcus reniformis]GGC45822.1 N-acetyltransferase GCN5 [Chelatococcus reniformis]